jgi:hypothetical protein
VAFSPDGATLAAGASDHLVHLWDLETGRELTPLRGHTWNVSGIVFSADGRWLYSVGWDGALFQVAGHPLQRAFRRTFGIAPLTKRGNFLETVPACGLE